MRNTKSKQHLRAYLQFLPSALLYQIVTGLIISGILTLLEFLVMKALADTGRIALTSGDSNFLFSSWQGWAIVLLFVITLIIGFCMDVNVKILNADHHLNGKKVNLFATFLEALLSIRRFLTPFGLLIIVFISFSVPLVGIGFTSSITEGFQIPPWIYEGFLNQPWWPFAKYGFLILLGTVWVLFAFALHYVLLNHEKPIVALKSSLALVKAHFVPFVLKYILLCSILIPMGVGFLYGVCTDGLLSVLPLQTLSVDNARFVTIFVYAAGALLYALWLLLIVPTQILIMTRLFYQYTTGEDKILAENHKGSHVFLTIGMVGGIGILSLMVSIIAWSPDLFDKLFPAETQVKIVAHRLGGNLGPENTLECMQAAELYDDCWGNEMDIQRTKDGYYIVNHDDTFLRLCGVNKKSTDLTLEEIQQLRVRNTFPRGIENAPVSTFQEILDEAKVTGQFLFVELKGATADTKMADDIIAMVKEAGLEDQCLIMSLKYNVIDYAETTYPEMFTGYIYSYAYGHQADLNCDAMILEVTPATSTTIDEIHAQDKQVFVWTVDTKAAIEHFMKSDVDAIITNEVASSVTIQNQMARRNDQERIRDYFRND